MHSGTVLRQLSVTVPLVGMLLLSCQHCVEAADTMSGTQVGSEATKNDSFPDVPDFWPEVAGDLRKVTWAHAVNSRKELANALAGDVMMLEADVSISEDGNTPIMAHPPATTSDLTLQQFLRDVVASKNKKGIKLDFKSTSAWESASPLLKSMSEELKGIPLWLNADVVQGPGGKAPGVEAQTFLGDCVENFAGRTLSVGWTTSDSDTTYTKQQMVQMQEVLSMANVSESHPLTFPVRAAPAAQSVNVIMELLEARPKATLTFWGAENDKVDNDKLLALAKEVTFARVYVDLPIQVPGLNGGARVNIATMLLMTAAASIALLAARL